MTTYCSPKIKKELNLFSHPLSSAKSFDQLLSSKALRRKRLLFIEKVSLWLLFQMNTRPDLSSPTSRLQVYIKTRKSQPHYWDFHVPFKTKNHLDYFPYLEGLEVLLKTYRAKKKLKNLAKILDHNFPTKLKINKELAFNISQNKDTLKASPLFKKAFFKGNEPIKENESLPKLNFSKLVKNYSRWKKRNKKRSLTSRHLFSLKTFNSLKEQNIRCNIDLSLYKHSIYLIGQGNTSVNLFGLSNKKGEVFIGVSSQSIKGPLRPLFGTFLIKALPPKKTPALCLIENYRKNSKLALISYKGRDPGQYLYNIMKKGVFASNSLMDLDIFLRAPRRLVLVDPLRVLAEPTKKTSSEYQKYRNQNIPIYPVKNLGNIMGHAHFPLKGQEGFVLDKRSPERLSCLKKSENSQR
ncbi:MAG: hypothetical protein VYD54_12255 [Bdellovibrionota bacterium]|nr:hypothetical protein [Bdellovibrionota bacterium]